MGRKPKANRKPYGEWLLYLRSKNGLTQDDVKRELKNKVFGWSDASSIVSKWETEGRLPGREIIIALAEIYGVSIETLLGVERTANGRYSKRDSLIEAARAVNKARAKTIKEHGADPML